MSTDSKNQPSYSAVGVFNNMKYLLSIFLKENGGKLYIIRNVIASVLSVLFTLVYTIMPGLIISEIVGQKRLRVVIFYIAILLITPLVQTGLDTLFAVYNKKSINKIIMNVNRRIFYHSVDMDYENYDKPEYNALRDRVHNTMSGLEWNIAQVIAIFSSILSIITISSVMAYLNFWIIILIVIGVVFNSFITKKIDKKKFVYDHERSKWNNFNWVYRNSLQYNWNIKDVRLFGIKDLLIDSWTDITKKENAAIEKSSFLSCISSLIATVFNFVQQVFIYAFIVFQVFSGKMDAGSMTILLSSVAMFSSSMKSLAGNYLGISERSLYIDEVKQFFSLPQRQLSSGNKTPVFDDNSVIEFRNVSFKYNGSEIYALKNLNIVFKGNEKLCIIGNNGAGKTTFIKLLTRLYFPTEGEILLNGVSIYEYDLYEYQRLFAPVFQDGGAFNFTMGKNITLASDLDEEKLEEIVQESRLKELIEKQPKKYETQVGKWLDEGGVDLSGGEEQRFKIARAIYHGGDIYLLDEPTAALDPVAEYEIYTRFGKMTSKKAAILITHRLAAAHLADKIAVFKDGTIAEYGTHDSLYNQNGIYTEMFDKQAKYYRI